jgi:hypothetical protein
VWPCRSEQQYFVTSRSLLPYKTCLQTQLSVCLEVPVVLPCGLTVHYPKLLVFARVLWRAVCRAWA